MNRLQSYLFALAGTCALGVAWWLPNSGNGAIFGWCAAILFALCCVQSKTIIGPLYLAGVAFQPIGFYWLYTTIADFGGFTTIPSLAIFSFYCIVSGLQFLIIGLAFSWLPKSLDAWALRFPLAWVLSEQISIRIFPWYIGHTQLGFPALAQIASLGGAPLISFLMCWSAESIVRFIWGGKQSKKLSYAIAPVLTLLAIFWGHFAITAFDALSPNTQAVALVQANVSVEDKHQVKSFVTNVTRYKELSALVTRPETLIIWPETVIMEWIFNEITTRDQDRRLPILGNKSTLLTGALTFDRERQMYNSALLIRADGSLGTPYHKQLLMPFGEYTPFGETFSWLKNLNATAGDFSPGKTSGLIDLVPGQGPKLAPLICYEDVVSDLARRATAQGARLLINLTNDAWFGDSLAPLQHHQIAAFRALENRRTLLRSTNTGFTAIVDPMGRTTSQLAKFSEGILEADAALLNETSVFVTLAADQLWYWGSLILACVLIGGRAINKVRFSK